MKWPTVAAWILVVTETLELVFIAAFGIDWFGAILTQTALLGLSLTVAVGISCTAYARRQAEPNLAVISPSPEATNPEVKTADPLDNRPWLALVEECVQLLEELESDFELADPERKELVEHVVLRLGEILVRAGVETIADEATFDRVRHQASKASQGMSVVETVSPGYAVGRRVLRRARVVVRPQ